jgi:hypothetical protein
MLSVLRYRVHLNDDVCESPWESAHWNETEPVRIGNYDQIQPRDLRLKVSTKVQFEA